jgi:hypothetical protein
MELHGIVEKYCKIVENLWKSHGNMWKTCGKPVKKTRNGVEFNFIFKNDNQSYFSCYPNTINNLYNPFIISIIY